MPMHDWKKVPDGISHAFHHGWISALSDHLNSAGLPSDYYALIEQVVASGSGESDVTSAFRRRSRFIVESEGEFYRRKKSWIAVRHVSGDDLVAILEIVSPGNKASEDALRGFVRKALELMERRVHLLLVDPVPPSPRDPNGIHAAIWEELAGESFQLPVDKPLTLAAYECDLPISAYIEPIAVGDQLSDMPLFMKRDSYINVPLEPTYQAAYRAMPRRWRDVLERT